MANNTTVSPDGFDESKRDFGRKQMLHDIIALIACLQYNDAEKTEEVAKKLFEAAKLMEEVIKNNPVRAAWAPVPKGYFGFLISNN